MTNLAISEIEPSVPSEVNAENLWRLQTPGGSEGWARSPYPHASKKYFMISCDTHLAPPPKLFHERIDPIYRDRLARVEVDAEGVKWMIGLENGRRERIHEAPMAGEDKYRTAAGGWRAGAAMTMDDAAIRMRIADQLADGIDGEVI